MSEFIHRMDWWGCNTFSGCFVKKEINEIIDQTGDCHPLIPVIAASLGRCCVALKPLVTQDSHESVRA